MSENTTKKEMFVRPTMVQLAVERAGMVDEIVAAGGEVSDEIMARMTANLEMIEDKTAAYVAVIERMDAMAEAAKRESEIAKAWEKAIEIGAQQLRYRLAQSLVLAGTKSVKASGRTVSVLAGLPSLVIVDKERLPAAVVRVELKEVETIDKEAIKVLLENGADLGGAAKLSIGPDTIRVTTPRKRAEKGQDNE